MQIHTLKNLNGVTIRFLPIGGAIIAIEVPDCAGRFDNVVLTFADPSAYADQTVYFGTVCGRYANASTGHASLWTAANTFCIRPTRRVRSMAEGPASTRRSGLSSRSP